MKKLFFFFFIMGFFVSAYPQINDSFNSAYHFPWQGDTSKFVFNNGELQSNSSVLNDRFSISQSNINSAKEWHLDLTLNFNTSSANYVDFYLFANNQDVENADTALFIKVGNTKDEISLYQRINGSTNLLIDGVDEVTKKSSSALRFVVKLVGDTLSLNYATSLANPLFLAEQKVQIDTHQLPKTNYTGLDVKQSTASFFGKHFFDNLYAGHLIRDTSKPKIQSIQVNDSSRITVYFSEPIESRLLQKLSSFSIVETGAMPVAWQTLSQDSVLLTFANSFNSGISSTLQIDSVMDLNGNLSLNEQHTFNYLRILEPRYKSLIITEVFAKSGTSGLQVEAFEIYNATDEYLSLAGCQLFDLSADEPFPNVTLAPKTYYVVCDDADTNLFVNFIPLRTMPSLNDATDLVRIENALGLLVTQLVYQKEWHSQGKDAGGWSLEMKDVEKGCYVKKNFTSSINQVGHTLGRQNSINEDLDQLATVKINRMYMPSSDQLELFWNTSIDYGVLINSVNYQFTPNIIIDSIAVDKANPKKVTLFLASSIHQKHQLVFKRFSHCSGATIPEQNLPFNYPKVLAKGDVQITEVMFNSETGCSEYLELKNSTDSFLDFRNAFLGVASSTKKEQLNISTQGIMFAPHQILVLAQSISALEACHAICEDAEIVEVNNWSTLDDEDGSLWISNFRNTLIDSVTYSSSYHSALLSDQDGVSLEKIDTSQSGLLARVWSSTSTDRNYATPGCQNTSLGSKEKQELFSLESPYFQTKDLFNSKAVIQYKLEKANYSVQIKVMDRLGLLVKEIANNELLATEGNYFWDGLNDKGDNSALGIYYIQIVAVHPEGDAIKKVLEVTKLD